MLTKAKPNLASKKTCARDGFKIPPRNTTVLRLWKLCLKKCYPKGFATLGESAMLRRQVRRATGKPRGHRSPRKIDVTGKLTVASVSVVTLIRTDTTLDHSQKAEKVCLRAAAQTTRAPVRETRRPQTDGQNQLETWLPTDWPGRKFVERNVGSSACTPAPSTRNCAVEYCIAASIGVTDVRVQ